MSTKHSRMSGMSLETKPHAPASATVGYQYAEVPQYQYADTYAASYGYANTSTGSTSSYRYAQPTYGATTGYGYSYETHPDAQTYHPGPSDQEVEKAFARLLALQKKGVLKPFKPKIAGWIYTSMPSKGPSSSSKPKPAGAGGRSKPTPKSRYMCNCGKSYGDDDDVKADLVKHLKKHTSHKRVKA
ncbi:hypothetical protein VTK56DRAFT_6027 [Thermocarpiscus australiensis]